MHVPFITMHSRLVVFGFQVLSGMLSNAFWNVFGTQMERVPMYDMTICTVYAIMPAFAFSLLIVITYLLNAN